MKHLSLSKKALRKYVSIAEAYHGRRASVSIQRQVDNYNPFKPVRYDEQSIYCSLCETGHVGTEEEFLAKHTKK